MRVPVRRRHVQLFELAAMTRAVLVAAICVLAFIAFAQHEQIKTLREQRDRALQSCEASE